MQRAAPLALILIAEQLGFLGCLPLAALRQDRQPPQHLLRFTAVRRGVRNPVLPLICPHFHSDDPDTGHSWQENPPSELKLGSFCVFFLTLEASLRSILTGHPGYSHKGTVIHSSLACWGSHLCKPRLCLLLFRYFPCLCPAPHR